jgi:hypothetical protein
MGRRRILGTQEGVVSQRCADRNTRAGSASAGRRDNGTEIAMAFKAGVVRVNTSGMASNLTHAAAKDRKGG